MEWLQHIVDWAQAHPDLSLAAAFALGLVECIVFIGLFLPGAALLFAIGALVSLDALPFAPTMMLIASGALIGDIASYELGRRYGVALFRRPFFARRPGLINKGGAFFTKHGGKGLVLAHLIGPLRPLVPAIAGTYGLSRPRFLVAIVPAAIAWTLVYVLPGVAFGASLGLAAEVTKRLAIVMLVAAGSLWLAFWVSRRAVLVLGRNAENWLNRLTDWSHRHGPFARLGAVADPRQPELPALVSLGIVLLVVAAVVLGTTWALGGRPPSMDLYAHDAMLHLREPWGVRFAAIAMSPGEPFAYGSFVAALMVVMALQKRWDVLRHLLVVMVFGILSYLLLTFMPGLHATPEAGPLRLRQDLVLPIAIYGLVPLLFDSGATINRRILAYGLVTAMLLFVVLSRFYLGASWLSVGLTTLLVAVIWTAGVGVSFRRHGARDLQLRSLWPAVIALIVGVAVGSPAARSRMQTAAPELAARPMAMLDWWDDGWRRLPTRRIDLAGRDKQMLNVQWAGQLPAIRRSLEDLGWEAPPRLGFATGLRWLATSGPIADVPLMPRMHAGHYAGLTMRHGQDDDRQLLVRLWPSGYVLDGVTPLWIGTVNGQRAGEFFRLLRYPVSGASYSPALATLTPHGFEIRDVHRSSASFPTRLLRPAKER